MKLSGMRFADTAGDPAGRRNVTFGVIQHLWRSPVPFVGFYPPEGVPVAENRIYTPAPPRLVDDTDYLAGVEAHKKAFAKDLENAMIPSESLPGYFDAPMDEGWSVVLDLPGRRLKLADAWGMVSNSRILGDLAPFVWAYRNSNFCMITLYDKDTDDLRDDLLFVAKRRGVELRWNQSAA